MSCLKDQILQLLDGSSYLTIMVLLKVLDQVALGYTACFFLIVHYELKSITKLTLLKTVRRTIAIHRNKGNGTVTRGKWSKHAMLLLAIISLSCDKIQGEIMERFNGL